MEGTGSQRASRNRTAARRGVDVRLLVPQRGDPPAAGWATRAAYEPLLTAGVRIDEYLSRKLHAKTCVIDEEWASIGSANLDYLSLFVNQELVLIARDRMLAEVLHVQYQRDLDDSAEVMCPSGVAAAGASADSKLSVGRCAGSFDLSLRAKAQPGCTTAPYPVSWQLSRSKIGELRTARPMPILWASMAREPERRCPCAGVRAAAR